MKITKIEPQKRNKNRVSVYIDETFAFGVDMEVAYTCGLKEGLDIDRQWLDEVVRKEEQFRAQNYALNLLSYRARSEREIMERMQQKGYESSVIEDTIAYLKEQGYLDDYAFAEMFIRDKSELNKYGQNRIKTELYKKGVAREVINGLIEEMIDSNSEYEKAKELAKKKIKSYQQDSKQALYRKLNGFLIRKGYPYDVVSRVVKELVSNMFDENES